MPAFQTSPTMIEYPHPRLTVMDSISCSPASSPAPVSPQRPQYMQPYHTAPEVAPEVGLEHDDHPLSDKLPVFRNIHSRNENMRMSHLFSRKGSLTDHDAGPPLIIFGMKLKEFLIVSLILACVLIAASVGGALGNRGLQNHVPAVNTSTYDHIPLSPVLMTDTVAVHRLPQRPALLAPRPQLRSPSRRLCLLHHLLPTAPLRTTPSSLHLTALSLTPNTAT